MMDRTRRNTGQEDSRKTALEERRGSAGVSKRRTPPVISRTEIGLNTLVMDRPAPRRRVDVPLSTPGAEIRLPAMPAVHNKWRLLSGLMMVCCLLALIFLFKAEAVQIKELNVVGVSRFSDVEISRALGITGKPIFMIDPRQVTRDLQLTYPGLSEVEVAVKWPDFVEIRVEERFPVLAWNWEGHVRWVDENGVAFEPHDPGSDIQQVRSSMMPPTIENRFVDPRIVAAVQALSGHTPEGVEIIFDAKHGLGWRDPRGWMVYFGFNEDDMAMKLIVYQSIVDYLQGKGITPAVINVEYLESPYFRMEK